MFTRTVLCLFTLVVTSLSCSGCHVFGRVARGAPHALDDLSRHVEAEADVDCSGVELIGYRGSALRYDHEARVHPAFAERLARFEAVVVDTAVEVYGRAPSELEHYGAYSCRRVRTREERLSEHAFGNALDVAGLRFPDLPDDVPVPPGLPEELEDDFRIRVLADYLPETDSPVDQRHALFFHLLMRQLELRDDIFRGMIGPPAAGHHNHLHLDAGRWAFERYELPLEWEPDEPEAEGACPQ